MPETEGNETLTVYLVVGQPGHLETLEEDSIGIMIRGH